MADEYIIEVKANTKTAEKAVEDFSNSAVDALKKVGAAAAVYLSFSKALDLLNKSIDGAMEAEKAIDSLNRSLASAGNYSKEASERFQEYASQLQLTTGVSDDLIVQNAAMLASFGKLSGDGLERASKAALDMAAYMKIDVASAFDIVTKATQGNIGVLKKYGLEVDKSASDSQKFAAALSFIEQSMGGSAAASANTFEGALKKVKNSFADVLEDFGTLITRSPAARAALVTIAESISKISDYLKSLTDTESSITSIINFSLAFSYVIASVLERIYSLFISVAGAFNYLVYGSLAFVELAIGRVIEKLGILASALAPGSALTQALVSSGQALTAHGTELQTFATGSVAVAGQEIKNAFAGVTEATGMASSAIIKFQSDFVNNTQKAKNASKDLKNSVVNDAKEMDKGVKTAMGFMAGAVTKLIGSMRDSVAEGKGMFANFGQKIMALFADMAIQIGQILLGVGFGMLALGEISPFAAIAAGIGLITIGTILKGMYGHAMGGATGGGGAAAGPGDAPSDQVAENESLTSMNEEQERERPQTGVQVIVQGNILDRRETGLAIAEIINETFDTNGVLIRANA